MTIYLFSSAILLNSFSMTGLMLFCGLAGAPELTADIAIVQGATLALFYAFSGNARNIIFADKSGSASSLLLRTRLILLLPLACLSFIFSSVVGSVGFDLALVLIGRRCSEWIGEVYLSYYELHDVKRPAIITSIAECMTLLAVLVMIFVMKINPSVSMMLWALAPLVAATQGKLAGSRGGVKFMENLSTLAPNLGSTTIIGITVYIFRLSIILLIGRIPAGDLFTAFGMGGLLPTVYSSSIGPSLALRAHRDGKKSRGTQYFSYLGIMFCLLGIAIAMVSTIHPAIFLNKSAKFWNAVGLSLAGGAIMMFALHLRILMLQKGRNIEIFGTDVLSNILIVISVPYFFFLFGARALEGLYLFNAILTLCFYWSSERMIGSRSLESYKLYIIAGLIVIPLFFQLGSGVFRDSAFMFDTGRVLEKLPIPVSVFGLAAGILTLGKFRDIHRSLMVFFFTSLLFVLAALLVQRRDSQIERLILMTQYLLPLLGLVLGEMYGKASQNKEFEKGCLIVICFIMPAQLICSWIQGLTILTPYLYIFSIYQHLFYVPVVMVLAGGLGFIGLWDQGRCWRSILTIILPVVGIYVVASNSIEACVVFLVFLVIGFIFLTPRLVSKHRACLLISIILAVGVSYGVLARTTFITGNYAWFSNSIEKSKAMEGLASINSTPENLSTRLDHWKYFSSDIISDGKSFFFGHPNPPDRRIHPSAYNYYLDLVYNFGFLAAIPLFVLIGHTIFLGYHNRNTLLADHNLLPVIIAVLFIFLIDNILKVGLRQPYPGIFGFFILGMLQARLVRSTRMETEVAS